MEYKTFDHHTCHNQSPTAHSHHAQRHISRYHHAQRYRWTTPYVIMVACVTWKMWPQSCDDCFSVLVVTSSVSRVIVGDDVKEPLYDTCCFYSSSFSKLQRRILSCKFGLASLARQLFLVWNDCERVGHWTFPTKKPKGGLKKQRSKRKKKTTPKLRPRLFDWASYSL